MTNPEDKFNEEAKFDARALMRWEDDGGYALVDTSETESDPENDNQDQDR
jgi:hypothetical protein